MVFKFKCFEFPSPDREIEIEHNGHSQTKSSSSQRGWTSSQGKSSVAESYYSAHADFVRSFVGPNDLEVFTYLELEQATGNFSLSSKIGEEEFGPVYKAVIQYPNKKLEVAVLHLNLRCIQERREWAIEVNHIGLVKHPNLVKLVGYCAEDDESGFHRLLVYEYLPKGSVRDHLSAKLGATLPWAVRLKIAQDVAYCLAYLHGAMEFQFIFGNFKSSNVLLDEQWNAKLLYFGLGRLIPLAGQDISRAGAEIDGYEAPELYITRNVTSMSDVWCYGVFLCELITGRCPFDQNPPKNKQKIEEWVKPCLNSSKCIRIVDSRLAGNYSLQLVKKLLIIAKHCLADNPQARPTMITVLLMINQAVKETTRSRAVEWFNDKKCGDFGCLSRLCSSKPKASP